MANTKKKKNQKKKLTISEEDVSLLLQRYSASTIIALLQEVAQFPDAKIDWNELVKKTKTGIANAGEYQMLWRHLAYRDTLLEHMDHGAEPFEDDSDFESDLEAFPPISKEASAEAAACVKVLLGSRLPNDDDLLNHTTVEASLTINIPNCQTPSANLDNPPPVCTLGKNITISVYVQRRSAGGGLNAQKKRKPPIEEEELEGSRSTTGGLQVRKRRNWTAKEDLELIAAVQKCGERNWANIIKGDFNGDRTAAQLSQRWSTIRKRLDKLGGKCLDKPGGTLTEAQLATRRAVSFALNIPMVDSLSATCSVGKVTGAIQSSMPSSSAAVPIRHLYRNSNSRNTAYRNIKHDIERTKSINFALPKSGGPTN